MTGFCSPKQAAAGAFDRGDPRVQLLQAVAGDVRQRLQLPDIVVRFGTGPGNPRRPLLQGLRQPVQRSLEALDNGQWIVIEGEVGVRIGGLVDLARCAAEQRGENNLVRVPDRDDGGTDLQAGNLAEPGCRLQSQQPRPPLPQLAKQGGARGRAIGKHLRAVRGCDRRAEAVPHRLDLTDLSLGALQVILGGADPAAGRLDGFGQKAAMIVMLATFRAQLPLLSLQCDEFAGGIEEGELVGSVAPQ